MVPAEHEATLRLLVRNFLAENAHVNLSAFRTEDACWAGNVLDSVPLLDVTERLGVTAGSRFLDVGTGGGFPMLALAACLPECGFTGLDSTGKKIEAVRRIAEGTGLDNVEGLIADRAEVAGRSREEREAYDFVLARAIGATSVVLEYCAPFAKVGGRLIIWKSMHIEEELMACANAEEALGCEMEEPHRYDLGEAGGQRQLVIYRKVRPTTKAFPRPVGQAKKHPL